MGLEFVDRVVKTTSVFSILSFPFLLLYFGISPALSVLIGAFWGVLNLLAIKYIIVSLLRQGKRRLGLGLFVLLFKIPVLYGIGYFLIKWDYLSLAGLLWGFSGILIVSALKGLSRSILGLNEKINGMETQV